MAAEVVLITGGSGFLGQHIVRELQKHDSTVTEIRILDLEPYKNNMRHSENIPITVFIGNIENKDSIKEAFKNVNCVFHCAALISYEFPPDDDALNKTNVQGTKNIIELCVEFNIPHLVFTSSTEITMTPYSRLPIGLFSVVVNQTEVRVKTPDDPLNLLFPGYPASKLKGEQIVLAADNTYLRNGGKLRTVALRPTLMYGEEDFRMMPFIMKVANNFEGSIFRLAGLGGKHQLTYAGNVAWAHICAKNILQQDPTRIAGLPVFINDDSPVRDIIKFSLNLINNPISKKKHYRLSWWYLPIFISYIITSFIEFIFKLIYPSVIRKRLPVAPKSVVTFLGSILLYSRLRASIHLNYSPIYTYKESEMKSVQFYTSERLKNYIKPTKTQQYLVFH
ncbi:3 beta-hydroxysteroid dehydrogenase/Delta 5--_4-isomerase type 1 [Lycorma delicatula]|uniref:3 beta-hydroxysteroid dehydrogenase/Delta 5-->4-isomerase type 1 n=1 Tax=Lycorma delicatula TaxID=130591 RepID=UPI003F517BCA